mmetsp:Transcript_93030/g.216223  ORF Transcript_93030/g.216223 Transcript_93030/m.216223 type:complete len:354 (-) Transcript_93030:773-1834(-)
MHPLTLSGASHPTPALSMLCALVDNITHDFVQFRWDLQRIVILDRRCARDGKLMLVRVRRGVWCFRTVGSTLGGSVPCAMDALRLGIIQGVKPGQAKGFDHFRFEAKLKKHCWWGSQGHPVNRNGLGLIRLAHAPEAFELLLLLRFSGLLLCQVQPPVGRRPRLKPGLTPPFLLQAPGQGLLLGGLHTSPRGAPLVDNDTLLLHRLLQRLDPLGRLQLQLEVLRAPRLHPLRCVPAEAVHAPGAEQHRAAHAEDQKAANGQGQHQDPQMIECHAGLLFKVFRSTLCFINMHFRWVNHLVGPRCLERHGGTLISKLPERWFGDVDKRRPGLPVPDLHLKAGSDLGQRRSMHGWQ